MNTFNPAFPGLFVAPTPMRRKTPLGTGLFEVAEPPSSFPLGSGLFGVALPRPQQQQAMPAALQAAAPGAGWVSAEGGQGYAGGQAMDVAAPRPRAQAAPVQPKAAGGLFSREGFENLLSDPRLVIGLSLLGASNSPNPWGAAAQTALQFGENKLRRQQQAAVTDYQRAITENMQARNARAEQEAEEARKQRRAAYRFLYGHDPEEDGLFGAQPAPSAQPTAAQPRTSGYDLPPSVSPGWTSGYDVPAQDAPTSLRDASLRGIGADTMRLPQPLDWGAINAAYAQGQPARDNDRLRILQEELSLEQNPEFRTALEREIARVAPHALPAVTSGAGAPQAQAPAGAAGFQVAPGARRETAAPSQAPQGAAGGTDSFVAGLPRTQAGELDIERMTPGQLQGTSLLLSMSGQNEAAATLLQIAKERAPRNDPGRYQIIEQDGSLLRVDKAAGTVDVLGQSQAPQGAAGGRSYGKQFRMAADGTLIALDPGTGQAAPVTDENGQPLRGFTQQPRTPGVSPQAGSGGARGGKGKAQLVSEMPDESLTENIAGFDRFLGKVDTMRNNPRLSSQTGLLGSIGGRVPGSGSYDLRADVASLQSELGLSSLKQMAAAGASLGPYSNADIKLLVSRIENLDPDMSAPAFKRALDGVYSEIARIRELHDAERRRRSDALPSFEQVSPRETRRPMPRPAPPAPQSPAPSGAAVPSAEQKKRIAEEIWGQ